MLPPQRHSLAAGSGSPPWHYWPSYLLRGGLAREPTSKRPSGRRPNWQTACSRSWWISRSRSSKSTKTRVAALRLWHGLETRVCYLTARPDGARASPGGGPCTCSCLLRLCTALTHLMQSLMQKGRRGPRSWWTEWRCRTRRCELYGWTRTRSSSEWNAPMSHNMGKTTQRTPTCTPTCTPTRRGSTYACTRARISTCGARHSTQRSPTRS